MDVSNQSSKMPQEASPDSQPAETHPESEPGGVELLQTVVSLTGLPEDLVYDELEHILKATGDRTIKSEELTLDELRTAMLAYLETMHANLTSEAGESGESVN